MGRSVAGHANFYGSLSITSHCKIANFVGLIRQVPGNLKTFVKLLSRMLDALKWRQA